MRTLVLGDIHGAHRALVQVLERCAFDPSNDRVVFVGDVADGWPDTAACIDELLRMPHLVHLIGNHDEWFRDWVEGGTAESIWIQQGGMATVACYQARRDNVPAEHRAYLSAAKLWHQNDGRIFVHGGWPWHRYPHPSVCPGLLTWDRELWRGALENHGNRDRLTQFEEVFVGHTTTTRAGFTEPVQRCEVWNVDQGAGWEGRLSILDVDSKEFWQSDVVATLYPEATGRRRSA